MRTDARLDRRAFLGSTLTAALTATTGGILSSSCRSAGDRSEPKKKVIVGAHPWVYAATQPNYDIYPVLDGIFADMSDAGIEAIELMHTALRYPDAVDRIRRLSGEHALPVIGTSFGGAMWDGAQHETVYEDARLIVPRLAALGGRTLGTSVGSAGRAKTPEQLDAQADLLQRLIALCDDHGVALNLHNHTYEVENNMHDLKGTLARIPDIPLGPDLNWLVRGGVNPVDFIETYGDQIVFLHLRDQHADGTWSEALGEGDMDYSAIAQALKGIHFSGDVVIELAHESDFTPSRPLRESLRISRIFVKRTLGY